MSDGAVTASRARAAEPPPVRRRREDGLDREEADHATTDETASGGTPWTAFERTAHESTSSATIAPEQSAWRPATRSRASRKPPNATSAATAANGTAKSSTLRARP